MKTKTFNKTDTVWTVLIGVLALLLCAALVVGVTGKTKAEYIPAPPTASDDFSGTMLSNYDNLILNFSMNQITFDFIDVDLLEYDYVVLDVCNSNFECADSGYIGFGPAINGLDLSTDSHCSPDENGNLKPGVNGLFNEFAGTFTYIFDMTGLADGVAKLHLYHDGVYYSSFEMNDFTSTKLESFRISYQDYLEYCQLMTVSGLYLYGFENARDCTIGDFLSDHTLKLTDCKDSMLYTGE